MPANKLHPGCVLSSWREPLQRSKKTLTTPDHATTRFFSLAKNRAVVSGGRQVKLSNGGLARVLAAPPFAEWILNHGNPHSSNYCL